MTSTQALTMNADNAARRFVEGTIGERKQINRPSKGDAK